MVSAPTSHRLLVIGEADGIWILVSLLSDCDLKGDRVICVIKWKVINEVTEPVQSDVVY